VIADKADPFRYFYVGLTFGSDKDSLVNIRRSFDQVRHPVNKDRFNTGQLFLNMFSEIINPMDYADLMVKNYLHQIILLTYRDFCGKWEKLDFLCNGRQKYRQVVYEVMNFIDTHLCLISDLSEIADHLGYSYPYLSRIFSLKMGLSIQEYYQKKRFEKAAEMLRNTDSSITSIAECLHYQSIHTFSKAYRKNFGMSPTLYKELCGKSQICQNT
jgi:AraC-like DNA-binding protein